MKKILVFLCLMTTILIGETLNGVVSYVSDEDTLHLQTKSKKYKIRFYGIDAPESTQEYGLEAKEFVLNRVLNKEVVVEVTDTDRYGRKIGKIYYDDNYLNKEMVKNGYAWWYETCAKNDNALKEAQEYARNYKLGLWKSKNPLEPWKYRRNKKSNSKTFIKSDNNSKIEGKKDKVSQVVYVTKSGKKYHHKECSYLKSIYASYTIEEAEALGYEPCSRF